MSANAASDAPTAKPRRGVFFVPSQKSLFGLILRRVAMGMVTLVAISATIFFVVSLLPGDFAEAVLGQSATPETLDAFRRQLGLGEPGLQRYLVWLVGVFHGEMGHSLASGGPVAEIILPRFYNTLFLAGYAAVIAVPLSIGLGIVSAYAQGRTLDHVINTISLTAVSVPEFLVGYILIWMLAVKGGLFPSLASISPDAGFGDRIYILFLPAMTLVLVIAAHMARMTRTAIVDVMSLPYVEMAALKGLPRWRVVFYHALPNAWAPIISVVALDLGYLITGAVVVEVTFVYPGLGQLLIDSVSKRDVPVVQACCLVFGSVYIFLNLIADILAIIANPRLRGQ